MIDFLYSRMLTTFVSVALTGIILMASIGIANHQGEVRLEEIAKGIKGIISAAQSIEAASFEHRISLDPGIYPDSLKVEFGRGHFSVIDSRNKLVTILEIPVLVRSDGVLVDEAVAVIDATISISSKRAMFEKTNHITIDVIQR